MNWETIIQALVITDGFLLVFGTLWLMILASIKILRDKK